MSKVRSRVGRPSKSGPEATPNSFNDMSQAEKRTAFVEAAARLFEAKGYANTSIKEITNDLGLSQGIFYYYWSNKKELIDEIHTRLMTSLNEQLDHILSTTSPPEAQLEEAIRSHIDVVINNKSLVATLMKEFTYSEEILKDRRDYTDRLQELFDEGISAGVVKEVDSRTLTFAVLGLCRSLVQWYQPGERLSQDELKDTFVRFAVEGYVCRPE